MTKILHFTPCLHSSAERSGSELNKRCVCTQDIKTDNNHVAKHWRFWWTGPWPWDRDEKHNCFVFFFFSCLPVYVLLGPTSQDSRSPFVLFLLITSRHCSQLQQRERLIFTGWMLTLFSTSRRAFTCRQHYTCSRQLEGREGAFMK